jgi:hypothetical protein
MNLAFAPYLHGTENCRFHRPSLFELSPLFSGGEGEIRTTDPHSRSISY